MSEFTRVDKWLWATRIFKSRGLAATACAGGKVMRAGHPLKPASALHPGDVLEVPFPEGPGARIVEVKELISMRVGAPQARACYDDRTDPAVFEALEIWLAAKREAAKGRPTKRDRREIGKIRGFFD